MKPFYPQITPHVVSHRRETILPVLSAAQSDPSWSTAKGEHSLQYVQQSMWAQGGETMQSLASGCCEEQDFFIMWESQLGDYGYQSMC